MSALFQNGVHYRVTQLVGLERKRFEGAMRAVREYITGLHRISDNLSLAYALLVMSIESLAQQFDGHVAEWEDYEHRKRQKIDDALAGTSAETSQTVENDSQRRSASAN